MRSCTTIGTIAARNERGHQRLRRYGVPVIAEISRRSSDAPLAARQPSPRSLTSSSINCGETLPSHKRRLVKLIERELRTETTNLCDRRSRRRRMPPRDPTAQDELRRGEHSPELAAGFASMS